MQTMGVDLSPLFNEILMFTYVEDLVCKKMVYFYLIKHCHNNRDTAILTLNALIKDCKSKEFRVRGLALRNMSNINFREALQYT